MASFVYAIGMSCQNEQLSGLIKLGRSDDPEGRLANMQVGTPLDLCIRRLWRFSRREHSVEFEGACHRRSRNDKFRGEWFSVGLDEVHEYIVELAAVRMIQISHADKGSLPSCPFPPPAKKFSISDAAIAFMERRRATTVTQT